MQRRVDSVVHYDFFEAAKNGDVEELDKALKTGKLHVNYRDESGFTALHWVARTGDVACMNLLLKVHGVDVNAKDDLGWTPLHYSCFAGNKDFVLMLIQHNDIQVDIQNGEGKVAVEYAKGPNKKDINILITKLSRNLSIKTTADTEEKSSFQRTVEQIGGSLRGRIRVEEIPIIEEEEEKKKEDIKEVEGIPEEKKEKKHKKIKKKIDNDKKDKKKKKKVSVTPSDVKPKKHRRHKSEDLNEPSKLKKEHKKKTKSVDIYSAVEKKKKEKKRKEISMDLNSIVESSTPVSDPTGIVRIPTESQFIEENRQRDLTSTARPPPLIVSPKLKVSHHSVPLRAHSMPSFIRTIGKETPSSTKRRGRTELFGDDPAPNQYDSE